MQLANIDLLFNKKHKSFPTFLLICMSLLFIFKASPASAVDTESNKSKVINGSDRFLQRRAEIEAGREKNTIETKAESNVVSLQNLLKMDQENDIKDLTKLDSIHDTFDMDEVKRKVLPSYIYSDGLKKVHLKLNFLDDLLSDERVLDHTDFFSQLVGEILYFNIQKEPVMRSWAKTYAWGLARYLRTTYRKTGKTYDYLVSTNVELETSMKKLGFILLLDQLFLEEPIGSSVVEDYFYAREVFATTLFLVESKETYEAHFIENRIAKHINLNNFNQEYFLILEGLLKSYKVNERLDSTWYLEQLEKLLIPLESQNAILNKSWTKDQLYLITKGLYVLSLDMINSESVFKLAKSILKTRNFDVYRAKELELIDTAMSEKMLQFIFDISISIYNEETLSPEKNKWQLPLRLAKHLMDTNRVTYNSGLRELLEFHSQSLLPKKNIFQSFIEESKKTFILQKLCSFVFKKKN